MDGRWMSWVDDRVSVDDRAISIAPSNFLRDFSER
jgi:hypothetical protein